MGSRIKSLFFGWSSSNNNALKGGSRPYDSTVALEPPVKGSYPVAGNGPNVLEELQRSRAKKEARQQSIASRRQSIVSSITAAPSIPRKRDDATQRPRTAPHNGIPGGGQIAKDTSGSGRTRSGFSMKSPPSFFSNNRRNSVRSTSSFITVEAPPPLPQKPIREIQTYQPTKGPTPAPKPAPTTSPNTNGFNPPFAQHSRTSSHASHKSHVDLLDAHSNIRQGREASQDRAKASGLRNYGEDVADRNIADFGDRELQKLDLNSPDFSYLKSVYVPKRRQGGGGDVVHNRAGSSALGHVLENSDGSGDDTTPQTHGKSSSIQSFTEPRTGMTYPARVDSASAPAYGANRGRDDDRSSVSNGTYDRRGRALSPLSSAPSSIYEEPPAKDPRRPNTGSTGAGSTPSRGRKLVANNPPPVAPPPQRVTSPAQAPSGITSPVQLPSRVTSPVPAPPRVTSPTQTRQSSAASRSKQRQRTMSTTSQSTNGGTKSRNGSVSYSAFPNTSRRESPAPDHRNNSIPRSTPNSGNKRTGLVEVASEPSSLEGVVDLNNTVDTDVTTKTLPAVVHETIQPTRHQMRQEVITREIHTHDVLHRALPVIQTDFLPTKHYVYSPDGKSLVETPESRVPGRTSDGSPSLNWKAAETAPGEGGNGAVMHHQKAQSISEKNPSNSPYTHQNVDEEDGADGPVIALARGEPKSGRSRGNSRSSVQTTKSSKSGSKAKNIFEPILSSRKESISREGIPKTEYAWRHPPTFENGKGVSQGPVYLGAGVGDLSGEYYYSDEEDIEGAEFGAMRSSMEGEGNLLFRDSGYGSPGVLPGLKEETQMSVGRIPRAGQGDGGLGNLEHKGDRLGKATKALRRLRERREASVPEVSDGEMDKKGLGA